MAEERFNDFVALLCRMPSSTWDIVLQGPAWKCMQPYKSAWDFGRFATLFVTLGLNNYQTKGKAEQGYWPKALHFVPAVQIPKQPTELLAALEPFYSNERLGATKVDRLERFLESELCQRIWTGDSISLGADFENIWRWLAETMRQRPTDKTIAFAMKCLAYALLMVGELRFDFGSIPVPVDSRVRMVSARLGISEGSDAVERERWRIALDRICQSGRQVTMVQLDSLLWQIGTLPREEMRHHLLSLGAGDLANEVAELLHSIGEVAKSDDCRL